MLKLSLKIERVVSDQEAEAIAAIIPFLTEEDEFRLENIQEQVAVSVPLDEAPEPPSQPVVIKKPRGHRRTWEERVEDAFSNASNRRQINILEFEELRQEFVWNIKDMAEWKPFPVDKLPDVLSVATVEEGVSIVKDVLRQLGREPAKGDTILMPPQTADWEKRLEMEDKARRERNMKLTGDPNIGFPDPSPGEATVSAYELSALLDSLDWSNPKRHVLSMRSFLEWAHIPYNRGNAIKTGCAVRMYGKLEVDHKTGGYQYLKWPLPKGDLPPYPKDESEN